MNRLRDELGWDLVSVRGIALLRDMSASHDQPDLKRRVWTSLQQKPVAKVPARRHPRANGFALATLVIASAASAGAAIGGRWLATRVSRRSPIAVPAAQPATLPRHRRVVTRRLAEADIGATTNAVPALASPVEAAPLLRDAALHARRFAHRKEGTAALGEARPEVLDALIALRRDRDPTRAATLLDHYLAANRHGALREEALALAIEAADALHDLARAAHYAHGYLHEFPAGRYSAFVRPHLRLPASAGAPNP